MAGINELKQKIESDEELEAVAGGSIDDFREMWENRKIIDREKEEGKNVEELRRFI